MDGSCISQKEAIDSLRKFLWNRHSNMGVMAFGSAHNLVATFLDSNDDVGKKYCNGLSNVLELEERGSRK
ncbi:hypothetical protein VNO80_29226 [Phaseolus coccineus]|uniref:Uncharacterized protein n=1 Tax=Phaseolus coccineus TaxID=3886 RepID=A0AAN9LAY7_PHACN